MKKGATKPYVLVIEEDRDLFEQLWRRLGYLLCCPIVRGNNLKKELSYARDMRPFKFFRTVVLGPKTNDSAETVKRKIARIKRASPKGAKIIIFTPNNLGDAASLGVHAVVNAPEVPQLAEAVKHTMASKKMRH
jgi:hypothetical protein